MTIPTPVGEPRRSRLFPEVTPDPPPGTFELGLVLGGTVSAGAYTAGALDFLLAALDAWHAPGPPRHTVIIRTAAGSSGGAVCAAILGLLSSRKVPHITQDPAPGRDDAPQTGNPLWDLWVNDFRIDRLLATDDIDARQDADLGSGAMLPTVQHVPSLLNCQMIDEAGQRLAAIGSQPGSALPYFAAPFRVAVTVANLRGIPYKLLDIPSLADYSGAAYVQHDDFAWFAFPNGASPQPTATSIGKREDEFWLGSGSGSGFVGYDSLVAYATASGAMPVGLAARALSRPAEHYHYRPKVRAVKDKDLPEGYRIDWPEPDWSGLPDTQPGDYGFTAVDGGTFNNDPVSLVHRALAGLVGQNPRGRSDARRAILMIDPLADQSKPIGRTGKSLLAVVETIIGTVVSAARYLTADMELFAKDDVFSRFQLVPFRPEKDKVGEAALAGTSLYAAGGWTSRSFRAHDYLLGRANMHTYLRHEFVLAGDNPLFEGWTLADRQDWAMDENGDRVAVNADTPAGSYFLPIIPTAEPEVPVPAWPARSYDPATLEAPLRRRLNAVVKTLVSDNAGTGVLPWLIEVFAVPGVVNLVSTKIVEGYRKELVAAGLL
jgi:predicted acylesterase/phospholipase RssA